MSRVHNFSAGPAVLPMEVLEEVQKDLVSYKGKGLSVMEMSHRSPNYQAIIDDAMERAARLMGLGDDYSILFLQGGASTQFLMTALNFGSKSKDCCYVNTGSWSTAAIKEAKILGLNVNVVASSEDKGFTYIPKDLSKVASDAAYLHITTNNTIRGTEYQELPSVAAPLIADMSSNMLSRPYDFKKCDLIYAGAQKNIGPAGTVLAAIKKSFADSGNEGLSTMMDYRTHISKGSMFNTPPTFSIYVVGLVLKWIENNGGLAGIHEINKEKAAKLYNLLDSSDFYRGTVVPEDRSLMNIPFRLPSEDLEKKFLAEAGAANMLSLKGHRSVGGCRASFYNAMPMESVDFLVDFMKKFESNNK